MIINKTIKQTLICLLVLLTSTLSAPTLSQFTLEVPDASKDYSRIFRLNPDETYSQELSNLFSLISSLYFSSSPFGQNSFWGDADNLQMGSFRLKNGMRLNTYALSVPDYCETHHAEADAVNITAMKHLTECCKAEGSRFIHLSTDFVRACSGGVWRHPARTTRQYAPTDSEPVKEQQGSTRRFRPTAHPTFFES